MPFNYLSFWARHNHLLDQEIRRINYLNDLPTEEYKPLLEKRKQEVLRVAFENSSFYRSLYTAKNITRIEDIPFSTLPITVKSRIKGRESRLIAKNKLFLKKAHTSGTSGSPLTIYRSPRSILKENAYLWYFRGQHGLRIGERVVSLRGNLDASKISYFNKAENILYLSSYNLSASNINEYYRLIQEFKPKAIWAYPSSVYSLVQLLQRNNLQLSVPLVFTSSETLYEFQRSEVETYLNAKVFDWYGNAERTIALAQCQFGNYHEMPLYSFNEFQKNGIITTSLINTSFPLVRYFVDDQVEIDENVCRCGKTLSVRRILGRADDVVKLEDGTVVGRLDVCFKGVKNIAYSQIIQDELTRIKVNIVPDALFSNGDKALLERNLKARLNEKIKIEFNIVDETGIIKTKAGKYKLVISTLSERN